MTDASILSDDAREIIRRRYLRKNEDGAPVETIPEMFERIAEHVAQAETAWASDEDARASAETFYAMLADLRFLPNSPTFTGAGTPLGQLAACFVLPIEDDMGQRQGGIFQTLRDAALIQQTGGGNGFSFSRLRPKGSLVNSSMGKATGPVGFLHVYDKAFGEIAQGGTRRGANMAVLRVDHPDIEEFITCKTDEGAITNFNISVGVVDGFMQAVMDDEAWPLRFPDVSHPDYADFHGTLEDAKARGIPIETYAEVDARQLFEKIVEQAWKNGEPGMLFLDTANRDNPTPQLGRYESTNPCGEQFLMPYENCCLGAINLATHLSEDADGTAILDWEALINTIRTATQFLDDVVSANAYVPGVPQLAEAAHRARRIGLGITGLADVLYQMNVRYGSPEAQDVAGQLMEFIRYHAMLTSVDLAEDRGPFPAIEGSIYDPNDLTWTPPEPLTAYEMDLGRPEVNWAQVVEGLKTHGICNAAQTTVAPTGTRSTIAGVDGYGCEPTFALAYVRHVQDDDGLSLYRVSPNFKRALESLRAEGVIDDEAQESILADVADSGSCQDVEALPAEIRDVFVVSGDISAEDHVRMQAALQTFVDASISKTINFPASAESEDVGEAFELAWKLGCKGLTVYRTGSREEVVLETATGDSQPKEAPTDIAPRAADHVERRPDTLSGYTRRLRTPLGTAYVTINANGHGPFEVFLNVGKAGSDTAAVSEAIGRLVSLVLRLHSPLSPTERLAEVSDQLQGIGGRRALGFGAQRVLSLPDGLAKVLRTYLDEGNSPSDSDNGQEDSVELFLSAPSQPSSPQHSGSSGPGDLCPECGQATLINEEGCRHCTSCGHSEC